MCQKQNTSGSGSSALNSEPQNCQNSGVPIQK